MQAERRKILEMVAEGKISADDAEKLLDKIGGSTANATGSSAREQDARTLPEGT